MHRFDQDVMVLSDERFSFSGNVTDNWSINAIPNGGYLMAILANAMMQSGDKASTPVITANFLSRCDVGKVHIAIDKMATSRQFERYEARLQQNGQEKVRAFGTFADAKNECVLESYEPSEATVAGLESCIAIPKMPTYTLFDQMDIRLDPVCTAWVEGKLFSKSEMKGWVKFSADREFDVLSLLMIADAFPPAVLTSQGMVAWVPTIEFSVNVRKIPTTEWLMCIFRTRHITCGLLEEDGEIWDQNGELAAISRQIAQYRVHS